jgi:GNAT superfamily N-acetyltransferase
MAPLDRGEMRKCTRLSRFLADSGNVCPLEVHATDYVILPFSEHSAEVRRQTAEGLQKEWGGAEHVFTEDFIQKTWPDVDVMYVVACGDVFVGCMAVDRKNFYPFISNLLVAPDFRGRGFAGRLLELGETYARDALHFDRVKLWCKNELKSFYERRGWTVEGKTDDDGTWIMEKRLK